METWMQGRNAAQVMMREHRQLTTVIAGMKHFVRLKEAGAGAPGLMVFRAMLYYIREYPDKAVSCASAYLLFWRKAIK